MAIPTNYVSVLTQGIINLDVSEIKRHLYKTPGNQVLLQSLFPIDNVPSLEQQIDYEMKRLKWGTPDLKSTLSGPPHRLISLVKSSTLDAPSISSPIWGISRDVVRGGLTCFPSLTIVLSQTITNLKAETSVFEGRPGAVRIEFDRQSLAVEGIPINSEPGRALLKTEKQFFGFSPETTNLHAEITNVLADYCAGFANGIVKCLDRLNGTENYTGGPLDDLFQRAVQLRPIIQPPKQLPLF